MPVTITRTAWTDDDGSGTTGTVINNAEKTALYNQIDAALALLLPLTGGTLTGALVTTQVATASGSTGSIATATPTTIFSATPAGRYEVFAMVAGASVALYTAVATVISDGVGTRIVANNGGSLTLTLSGTNVQVTQSSGGNETVAWSYVKVR